MKHLYYGYGKGKTTAAVGMAVRAAGAGMSVLFVQFLKSDKTSERHILKSIDNITVTSCPDEVKFTYNMNEEEFSKAKAYYRNLWNETTADDFIKNFDMLIYDEALSLSECKILPVEEIVNFVKNTPEEKEIIFTAHTADDALREEFDYISNIKKEKHPFDKGVKSRKGIEY